MAVIDKLKEADLLDLKELFAQSNDASKIGGDFEFVRLPDGVYLVEVKKFEFKTKDSDGKIRASWQFEVNEAEGEYAGVLQFKSDVLDSKEKMTRFLKDVRKFGVEFETLDELFETLAGQVIGQPCLIKLETAELLDGQTEARQWLNIIVEEDGE